MTELMAIAVGGALGAVARFLLNDAISTVTPGPFPVGIFVVNIIGSFLIGILFVLFAEQPSANAWRALSMVGFLGAFTTFSTFSLQTLTLIESGQWSIALAYAIGSLLSCVLSVAMGIWLTRLVSGGG